MDFVVSTYRRLKLKRKGTLKEREKRDKYLDLTRELKLKKTTQLQRTNKLWTMAVMVIPIVFSALRTIHKDLIKGEEDFDNRGQVETIRTTALLRSTRILRKFLETWEDLLSLKLKWDTIGMKNSYRSIMIIIH